VAAAALVDDAVEQEVVEQDAVAAEDEVET